MKRFTSIFMAKLALVSALTLMLSGCVLPHETGPAEVGVRTKKGPIGERGVDPEPYPPGQIHWFAPFLNDWQKFKISHQNLEMTIQEARGDRSSADDLTFKTIDGNDISLDVIVTYQVISEMAPEILKHVAKNDRELREFIVRTVTRSKARDIFGELETEEFYVAERRAEKAEQVRDRMNEILNPYGVRIIRVGTNDYRFNPAYQKAIEDKKVADQQVEKNRAATRAAEEEYKKKVEEALGDVAKVKAKADGNFEQAKISADAYYEQQERLAQAIEAEGRAEAEAITSMNDALAGSGGEAMVKLAIAEALGGKRIIVLPMGGGGLDVRSTDVNSLLELYGLQSITER